MCSGPDTHREDHEHVTIHPPHVAAAPAAPGSTPLSGARDRLQRYDRLPGVQVAREILRAAFGVELSVVGADGPAAHVQGGVMPSSSEVCRASLFSRAGFQRCDAFYRGLAADPTAEARALACHLGLAAVWEPAALQGERLALVVASGFTATASRGLRPADPGAVARALVDLDPHLSDPAAAARGLPVVRGDRLKIVRAILKTSAARITAFEAATRRRALAAEGGLPGLWGLVGASPRMREVFEQLVHVAGSDATVLIQGESGTGKELVARAIVAHGARAGGPLVAQSCGSLADALLESTLFGHVRGAFSGADRASPGLFGAAAGGTLLLDEVGEMSPATQVKLLRVLQDGHYTPVGSTSPRTADVRVVATTSRDLGEMVSSGALRQDLFYRLNVLPLHLPPLRERPGDLGLLLQHFLTALDEAPRGVSPEALRCMQRYRWPGNVRELRAEVSRWVVQAPGAEVIGPEHLSAPVREAGGYAGDVAGRVAVAAAAGEATLAQAVEALERAIIGRGLERHGGNRTRLARELGISRTTLLERLRRFGLGSG